MVEKKKEPVLKVPSLQIPEEIMRKLQKGEIKAVLNPDGSMEEIPTEEPKPPIEETDPNPPWPPEPEEPEEPEEKQPEKPIIVGPTSPVTPAQTGQVAQKKPVETPKESESMEAMIVAMKLEMAHYAEAQKNYWIGYQDGFIRALDTISKKAD